MRARSCSRLTSSFFKDTATTEIYTLSLHDALPIWCQRHLVILQRALWGFGKIASSPMPDHPTALRMSRSEEHTSELQSLTKLVCRLLLEKKKTLLERCRARRGPVDLRISSGYRPVL